MADPERTTMNSANCLLELDAFRACNLAPLIFQRVMRGDFTQPGFMVLALPASFGSHRLRQCMVELKESLSELHETSWGEPLEYLSLGRFDQQTTTRLHLDGAPESSFLMLGYEPTAVSSEFQIADFTRCAHDLGLSPADFLRLHNPMFGSGQEKLSGYITTLSAWHEDRPRIVIINNSCAALGTHGVTAGVLHGAMIPEPDSRNSRVINSTMMAPARFVAGNPAMQVKEFLSTDKISGQILS
jgi:hypothetical protein